MLKKENTTGKNEIKIEAWLYSVQENQNLNYQKSCKEYGKAFQKIGEKGVIVSIYEKKEDK